MKKHLFLAALAVLIVCSLALAGCSLKPNDGVTDVTVEYIGQ